MNTVIVEKELRMAMRSVLVTGGNGYLGSVLAEQLRVRGYRTIVFDNCLTSVDFPPGLNGDHVVYIRGDVRDPSDLLPILKDVDAVVHLASVVGDPACNAVPHLAWDINYLGTIHLANACRQAGVKRFIFASTCSNYGLQVQENMDEMAPVNPQSIYAQTKIHSEHYLLSVRDETFSPCILRFATLYGLSPRMRFDLAVNIMTVKAALEHEVTVYGGEQWRPFLHVRDAARAILAALEPASASTSPEIYNCGSERENYTLNELGQLIVQEVPDAELHVVPEEVDKRSYRINFRRIQQTLNFKCKYRVIDGIREILAAIQADMYHDFTLPKYSNYMMILSHSQQTTELITL
jgi:nucleoside-diphosphate-sugar epimerase